MIDTHFNSQQKLILHFDTEKILKQPPIILLDGNRKSFATIFQYFFENSNVELRTETKSTFVTLYGSI